MVFSIGLVRRRRQSLCVAVASKVQRLAIEQFQVGRLAQNGDAEMYEIAAVRSLTTYDDGVNAKAYRYNDEQQKFYFIAQFINETRRVVENGVVVKPATYDVLVSRIGQTDWGWETKLRPVADIDGVKGNIIDYFKSHCLGEADNPPLHIIFE